MSASQTTSAPMRVRWRGLVSLSIALRACSTAAAPAVPSPGTCDRRASGLGGFADSPLVTVIACLRSVSGFDGGSRPNKNPRHPARVPSVVGGLWRLASVPPSSSVLPPGADNKPEKAVQPEEERAKKSGKRYIDKARALDRHVHAAAVRRDHDGDAATISSVELTQVDLR